MMRRVTWFVLLVLVLGSVAAQDSERDVESERQIVFGVAPFDGGRYGATFVPEQRDTIYLTAGFEHALTVNISDIYYWPITAEYRADFQGMNVQLRGDLEIYRDDQLVETLSQREYIYLFPSGPAGEPTKLLTGDEMLEYMAAHAREVDAYRSGERGAPPQATYQGPFPGFILELPAGEYRLEYDLQREGESFSMEKDLVVFPALDHGVTFQIIPEDKWTVSLESNSRSENVYMHPGYVIYIKTFRSFLFNHASFARMMAPQRPTAGIGLENSVLWISTPESLEDRSGASLRLAVGNEAVDVSPREYIVVQGEGSALGYDILEFDPELFPGESATFAAYRVPAPPVAVPVSMTVTDDSREYVRSLRTLKPSGLGWTITALAVSLILPAVSLFLSVRSRRRAAAVMKRHGGA